MNHQEMLNRAEREVNTRALKIKSSVEVGDLDCEYYGALGYISSMHDMGVFNEPQYVTALAVIDAALAEAEDLRTKKAAPGASNTESDKAKTLNSILGAKPEGVKPRAEAYVHMELFPGGDLKSEINGSGLNLSAVLAAIILAYRKSGMPEQLIRAAIGVSKEVGGGR